MENTYAVYRPFYFFASGVGFTLSALRFFTLLQMILPRIRIIVADAAIEPGTSAPEVRCATNEPPHLLELL